jgi:hypothetical protein
MPNTKTKRSFSPANILVHWDGQSGNESIQTACSGDEQDDIAEFFQDSDTTKLLTKGIPVGDNGLTILSVKRKADDKYQIWLKRYTCRHLAMWTAGVYERHGKRIALGRRDFFPLTKKGKLTKFANETNFRLETMHVEFQDGNFVHEPAPWDNYVDPRSWGSYGCDLDLHLNKEALEMVRQKADAKNAGAAIQAMHTKNQNTSFGGVSGLTHSFPNTAGIMGADHLIDKNETVNFQRSEITVSSLENVLTDAAVRYDSTRTMDVVKYHVKCKESDASSTKTSGVDVEKMEEIYVRDIGFEIPWFTTYVPTSKYQHTPVMRSLNGVGFKKCEIYVSVQSFEMPMTDSTTETQVLFDDIVTPAIMPYWATIEHNGNMNGNPYPVHKSQELNLAKLNGHGRAF